jgi:hypothetical protein
MNLNDSKRNFPTIESKLNFHKIDSKGKLVLATLLKGIILNNNYEFYQGQP